MTPDDDVRQQIDEKVAAIKEDHWLAQRLWVDRGQWVAIALLIAVLALVATFGVGLRGENTRSIVANEIQQRSQCPPKLAKSAKCQALLRRLIRTADPRTLRYIDHKLELATKTK